MLKILARTSIPDGSDKALQTAEIASRSRPDLGAFSPSGAAIYHWLSHGLRTEHRTLLMDAVGAYPGDWEDALEEADRQRELDEEALLRWAAEEVIDAQHTLGVSLSHQGRLSAVESVQKGAEVEWEDDWDEDGPCGAHARVSFKHNAMLVVALRARLHKGNASRLGRPPITVAHCYRHRGRFQRVASRRIRRTARSRSPGRRSSDDPEPARHAAVGSDGAVNTGSSEQDAA